jgi:glycosyltransferase involved in cell wall biosynthesis
LEKKIIDCKDKTKTKNEMIEGKNIICVGFPSWEGDYMKTIVQVLSVLALKNNVLYVDYQHTYKDVVFGFLGKNKAPVKNILGFQKRLNKIDLANGASVQVFTPPPVVPINWMESPGWYERILKLNARKISLAIQEAINELHFYNPIVINAFNPSYGLYLQGDFNEKLLLYYCYDEIGEADWCKKHGARLEEKFIPKVDGVITTSPELQRKKKIMNQNCHLVPNGVDFKHFYHPDQLKKTLHASPNANIQVGYLGSVDNRLDYDLLDKVIKKLPNWHFTFVGRITDESGKQKLSGYSNVSFLGAKPYEKLPDYLYQFDIGIIPFVKNEFTKGILPLKINEYLAAGIPVVTTDFADLKDFGNNIAIANTPESFAQKLKEELENNSEEKIYLRVAMAQENSWENRVQQLSHIIQKLLLEKKKNRQFVS